MKILSILAALLCSYSIHCQVEHITHFDFETEETSAQFLHFGSNMAGKMTAAVDNPHPTSLNTSPKVLPIIKGSDAEVWGGAFLNPDLEEPLDATFVREICMKVMFVLPGNLALKLESDPFDDPENWINVVEIPVAEEWVDICFDLDQPSLEGNRSYPYGKIYERLVFYPDFGKAGNGQDGSIYFIDDISIRYDWSGIRKTVKFGMDMTTYSKPFDKVYVAGSFNGWSGSALELQDVEGTGYYTGAALVATGEIEYKFTVDGWADQEFFHKYGECTKTTLMPDGNAYVNRVADITHHMSLEGMAWESCYEAGEGVDITWSVNMSQELVDDSGVYLAGGCCFGHGEYRMWDNYDDLYTLTIERRRGFEGHYTFTNGTCLPGWACKEDLQATSCGDSTHYHDRYLDPVTESLALSHCFGQCGTDGFCEPAVAPALTTFTVDMSDMDIADEGVMLSGTFSEWSDIEMEEIGSQMYAVSIWLMPGLYQWKFKNGNNIWEDLLDGTSCTMTTDVASGGYYINRFMEIEEGHDQLMLDPACFNYCESCESLVSDVEEAETEDLNDYNVFPTVSDRLFTVQFEHSAQRTVNVFSSDGILIEEIDCYHVTETYVDATGLDAGLYFIQVLSGDATSVTKVIVSR